MSLTVRDDADRRESERSEAADARSGGRQRVRRAAGAHRRAGHVPKLSVVPEKQDPAAPAPELVPGAEAAVDATRPPGGEDAALFARIADGDRDAFAELYRRYFRELYDFAARITRDREAAADIVQTVFARVWARAHTGEQVRSPRAWLYRVTRNAAIDEIRRRGRMAQSKGDDGLDFADVEDIRSREPARAVIDKELAELVWSTAASMSPDEYALLDLHVRRDLAPEEMADELGITTGALYTRLSRLRRSFEDALTVKLLTRHGEAECEELAGLITRLGARIDTPEGNKLLRAHILNCLTCQESRRRAVTASEILAGIAPVPLLPGVQDAVWLQLGGVLDLGGTAGAQPASDGLPYTRPSARGSRPAHFAQEHPLIAAAIGVAAAALLATGMWAVWGALSPAGTARDPSRVWSATHHPGERSSDSHIRIQWSRQPDALAYSVSWSHAPKEEPDAVADLRGSATGMTSPALAPGRWYFHLRTQGRDHSWTHTVHLGPFVIVARAAPPDSAPAIPPGSSGSPAATPARPGLHEGAPGAHTTPSPAAPTTPALPAAPARDSTPPSGQSVALAGGPYYRGLAVALVLRHGVDRASGLDPATGLVQRQTGILANGTCGRWTGTWRTIELERSTDSSVADGRCYRYRYRIADRAGNRSAFSRPSGVAMVDTRPPSAPVLSLSERGASTFLAGTMLFARPDSAGSFDVAATSVDHASGVAAIEFPALAPGERPTRRTKAPYTMAYTWSRLTVTAGGKVVIARDRAGNTARAQFRLAADGDPPSGMSVTLSGGPWFAVPVPLRVTEGSDGGSGVDRASVSVERQSALLQPAGCGAFGDAWTPVSLRAGADAGVQDGRCYRYRVSVSDNVGNRSSSPPSSQARIDTTAPSSPEVTLRESSPGAYVSGTTVFHRPGAPGALTVAAASTDAQSGIKQVLFPALAGAIGGGDDDTAPYAVDYTWTQALTAAGPQTVVARNGAGLTANGVFTLAADVDPPTGMSVTLLGGSSYPGSAVPIRVDEGSDAGSGVDSQSVTLERDSAPRTPPGCGSYTGVWTPLSIPGSADTTVVAGNCYRYRVSVSDNVGNRASSPPSLEAQVG